MVQSNFDFDIDNVSVKQVDPNDRWTLDTNWYYRQINLQVVLQHQRFNKMLICHQVKNKTTFTIEDYVSGDVRIRFRGGTTVNGSNRRKYYIYYKY